MGSGREAEEVTVKVWVSDGGGLMVNSSALSYDHPESVWQQIIKQGGDPARFGYPHPHHERFKEWSRDQLIAEIIRIEREFEAQERHYS